MNIVVNAVLYLTSSDRGWSIPEVSCVVQEVIESKVMEDDHSAEGEGGLVTVSGLYTQNPLQRSVSQLIDKKDEESWEPHFRRLDSGLVRTSLTSAGQMHYLLKHDLDHLSCLSVWRGGVCGLHQRLQHSQEGTHHVHRHQPLTLISPHQHFLQTSSQNWAVLVNSEQLWDSYLEKLDYTADQKIEFTPISNHWLEMNNAGWCQTSIV